MNYKSIIELVEDSKFIEALDEITIVVEDHSDELYRNALYLKRRVKKLENDYLNGLIERDYYDAKQNQLVMPIMDLIIETTEAEIKPDAVFKLNTLTKSMTESINLLKRRIIQNRIKEGEISNYLVEVIIQGIQDYIHPNNSKIMGNNHFKTDCSDFVLKLIKRKKELGEGKDNK